MQKFQSKTQRAQKPRGFTLIELMISITVLGLIMTIASNIYVNFFGSMRNLKAAGTIYNESRFLMERIVKEVRNGTIDYEEFYNQNQRRDLLGDSYDLTKNTTYGQDYCKYNLEFYDEGEDGQIGTFDDEPKGELAFDALHALDSPIQDQLFLINMNGDERTYIKRIEEKDADGRVMGKIGMLKLVGKDFGIDHINSLDPDLDPSTTPTCNPDPGENDGRIDTWLCEDGFNCDENVVTTKFCIEDECTFCTGVAGHIVVTDPANPDENSFVDITPASLDIVDLKFIVSPTDDPRKAFDTDEVQIQPHVTIKIVARANPAIAAQFRSGEVPDIVLESTVSARAMNEIITECNLKQCIVGLSADQPCPLSVGVCGPDPETDPDGDPAMQTCVNYLWTGCDTQDYLDYAEEEYGDADLYQRGLEYASCGDGDDECKDDFCTDGYDNDCDSFTDEMDPDCKFHLCNNGIFDEELEGFEECRDVGRMCQQIRPFEENVEITCNDDYDNDCDGYADEFDPDCIIAFCTNKLPTPENPLDTPFLDLILPVDERSYLYGIANYDIGLNEQCIDVGGICDLCHTEPDGEGNTTSCICGEDGCTGPKIVNSLYAPEGEADYCDDGLDNDCDGGADELDPDGDCQEFYCINGVQSCELAPDNYDTPDYLVDYYDTMECHEHLIGDNDEECVDVGGLCNGFRPTTEEDHTYIPTGESNAASPTLPVHTCTDGLDNDCNGLVDYEDLDCCPDIDTDDFIDGNSETCKRKPDGAVPATEYLDCDDYNDQIYPGAYEVCDDAQYPSTYIVVALREKPIDNNCSFISPFPEERTSSAWDHSDPACCQDLDGDGYGVTNAYIACPIPDEPDCDDIPPDGTEIHPGKPETGELCFNEEDGYPINDNCKTEEIVSPDDPPNMITVERANHIDWYRDKTGGIAKAYAYHYFEPQCCDIGGIEICDDNTYPETPFFPKSDENCNGLEGENDYFCLGDFGVRFFDNFTSNTHIASMGAGVVQNTDSGDITLGHPNDTGKVTSDIIGSVSLLDVQACETGYRVIISPTADIPDGTYIKFQLSGDNGASWCGDDACDGSDWLNMGEILDDPPAYVDFSNPDYQLKWRAELDGDNTDAVPTLNNINISYQCL
jgi:prepilin-type N-terminal cleavage/methylation domain-containing protein